MRPVAIGAHVLPVRTWNPAKDGAKETFSYIDIASVSQDLKVIEAGEPIACADAPSRARQLIAQDDVLVSTVRPNLNAVAKVEAENHGATASTGFCVLRANARTLDAGYLFHWVRTQDFISNMVGLASGQSYPAVSDRIIKASEIPLPPLDEQKRIAAILDQADALRRLRTRALDRLNALGQAIFHEMFGGRSEENHLHNTEALGSLCDLVRGSSPRPQGDPRYFDGPIPRLMIADITRDGQNVTPRIDSLTLEGASKSRAMKAGEVVMAVSGAVGLPAILATDACIHDGFVGFRSLDTRLTPEFLYRFLVVERARNQAKGTGAIWSNLTTDQVKRFQIPLPPVKLQQDYLRKLVVLRKSEATFATAARDTMSLFNSLQHRAFRGEL